MSKQTIRDLHDPEPDPLNKVSWNLLRPSFFLGIKSCLPGGNVSSGWVTPGCSLHDLPKQIQAEVDGYANVGSDEI
jgi:hypothetical protein